jgi:hypothetical protein
MAASICVWGLGVGGCWELASPGRRGELTKRKVLCQNKLTLLLMKPKAGGASQSTPDASNFKELYSEDNSISHVPSLYSLCLSFRKKRGCVKGGKAPSTERGSKTIPFVRL